MRRDEVVVFDFNPTESLQYVESLLLPELASPPLADECSIGHNSPLTKS